METRALAIAFFYATGTAIGGISGPLLFGQLINSGQRSQVFWSFLIGAVVMAAAGLVELWLGVAAERRPLEELALPLTVADAEQDEEPTDARDRQRAGTAPVHDDDPHGGHAERP
ncbi:sugar transporter domain protein [Mycobacterium kansasii 824]|nr:sugar transporter domain protein [Mycobacterium kansasii 824]OOK73687.1 sugar transporter domain protein [Mycobacterium kansasii]